MAGADRHLMEMGDDEISRIFHEEGFRITVIGLGYIGCVVAAVFAQLGQRVIGLERRAEVIKLIMLGKAPIYEVGLAEALKEGVESKKLLATDDPEEALAKADIVIVTVGTPIGTDRKVVFSYLDDAIAQVGNHLKAGTLVVLRSTVPPKTTETRVRSVLEQNSGLKAGSDFGFAFVPERTVEGRAMSEILTLPKIVGGIDNESTRVAATIFGQLGGPVIRVSRPRVAEIAKLFDNTYRDVNIALANELAMLSESVGVDYVEASRAANLGSERTHLLMAGPGVGGSCLTKDPYILLEAAAKAGKAARIVPDARAVNDHTPDHVVDLIRDALREAGREIDGSKIAVLGYAFKRNTDDVRNTPVKRIVLMLTERGADVRIFDPHVKEAPAKLCSLEEAVEGADCVLVTTDHSEFKDLSLDLLTKKVHIPLVLVDTRHMVDPDEVLSKGYIYRGVGRHPSAFLD